MKTNRLAKTNFIEPNSGVLSLRASKIGGCPRAYVLDLRHSVTGITTRQKLYFAVGKVLEPVIMEHAGYDPALLFNDEIEVRVPLDDDLVITGHPDSADAEWIIECKTMRSFAYKKMIKNGLEAQFPQYLVQGSVYAKGLNKAGVKYLCLDKDASTIIEIVVPWSSLEPYWVKAQANAWTIHQWLNKERLPGRPNDLPSWYCLEAYCDHHECRYNMAQRRKIKKYPIKSSVPTQTDVQMWDGKF